MRYPVPILINWGAKENKDAYVQHLAKVWTILDYLDTLYKRGQKDDLVLIIDGFDIHFQLPPEVIVSRYFQENERANKRIEKQVGAAVAKERGFKQTVIFGHDKLCWPTDWRRPACWVVPEASDPKKAYGPMTDADPGRARARWLNSGTVLGPVDDVRDIFRATLDLIHTNHTTDSDQFYFANIWAAQEYARRLAEPVDPFRNVDRASRDWPSIEAGQRTEYHFGLDYEAVLFQTMAFFREYLTWQTFDGKVSSNSLTASYNKASSFWKGLKGSQQLIVRDPYYEKVLPADLARARGPFAAALGNVRTIHQPGTKKTVSVTSPTASPSSSALPVEKTWSDLSLGYNAISNQVFPLLHFTGPKEFRHLWWPRLWFLPWAEELLKAAVKAPREPFSQEPIGGKIWWPGLLGEGQETKVDWGTKVGSWSDNGTFLGWDELCGPHERIFKELDGRW